MTWVLGAVAAVELVAFLWLNRSGAFARRPIGFALWMIFAMAGTATLMNVAAPPETPLWFRIGAGVVIGVVVYGCMLRLGLARQSQPK